VNTVRSTVSRVRARLARRYAGAGDDRGSIAIFAAIVTVPLLLLGGLLVVDATGRLRAAERADAVAIEAARAAAQAIDGAAALGEGTVAADPQTATAAAHAYLARAGVDGSVAVTGGTHITVTVADTYQTKFLSIAGVNSLAVSGHGQANLLHGVLTPKAQKGQQP
jgi:Flp pilus assembly protein TadG